MNKKNFSFKFEGVFEDNINTKNLILKYTQFIKELDSKNQFKFDLNKNSIKNVLYYDDNKYELLESNVESFTI